MFWDSGQHGLFELGSSGRGVAHSWTASGLSICGMRVVLCLVREEEAHGHCHVSFETKSLMANSGAPSYMGITK